MNRYLLSILLALGGSSYASAQQPVAPASSAISTISRADTTQAIHALFSRHRTGGWIWTAIGGAFAVRIVSVAINSNVTQGFTSTSAGTVVGVGLFGGIPAVVGLRKLVRFSKIKEKQIITLYENSNTLPPYVERRLKTKYFRR